MLKDVSEGDYVYIPAQTLLYMYEGCTAEHYTRVVAVEKPLYLMFVRDNALDTRLCDVFYEGNIWSIFRDGAYHAGDDDEARC